MLFRKNRSRSMLLLLLIRNYYSYMCFYNYCAAISIPAAITGIRRISSSSSKEQYDLIPFEIQLEMSASSSSNNSNNNNNNGSSTKKFDYLDFMSGITDIVTDWMNTNYIHYLDLYGYTKENNYTKYNTVALFVQKLKTKKYFIDGETRRHKERNLLMMRRQKGVHKHIHHSQYTRKNEHRKEQHHYGQVYNQIYNGDEEDDDHKTKNVTLQPKLRRTSSFFDRIEKARRLQQSKNSTTNLTINISEYDHDVLLVYILEFYGKVYFSSTSMDSTASNKLLSVPEEDVEAIQRIIVSTSNVNDADNSLLQNLRQSPSLFGRLYISSLNSSMEIDSTTMTSIGGSSDTMNLSDNNEVVIISIICVGVVTFLLFLGVIYFVCFGKNRARKKQDKKVLVVGSPSKGSVTMGSLSSPELAEEEEISERPKEIEPEKRTSNYRPDVNHPYHYRNLNQNKSSLDKRTTSVPPLEFLGETIKIVHSSSTITGLSEDDFMISNDDLLASPMNYKGGNKKKGFDHNTKAYDKTYKVNDNKILNVVNAVCNDEGSIVSSLASVSCSLDRPQFALASKSSRKGTLLTSPTPRNTLYDMKYHRHDKDSCDDGEESSTGFSDNDGESSRTSCSNSSKRAKANKIEKIDTEAGSHYYKNIVSSFLNFQPRHPSKGNGSFNEELTDKQRPIERPSAIECSDKENKDNRYNRSVRLNESSFVCTTAATTSGKTLSKNNDIKETESNCKSKVNKAHTTANISISSEDDSDIYTAIDELDEKPNCLSSAYFRRMMMNTSAATTTTNRRNVNEGQDDKVCLQTTTSLKCVQTHGDMKQKGANDVTTAATSMATSKTRNHSDGDNSRGRSSKLSRELYSASSSIK